MASEPTTHVIAALPNGVTIRRYRLTDTDALAHHGNDKEIWNNLRNAMPHPYTVAAARFWIELNQDSSKWVASGPYVPSADGAPGGAATGEALPTNYAICKDDQPIGSIGLVFGDNNEVYARNAEIGYWLSKEFWGQGIMGAVAPAFVAWSWATFGRLIRLNAIWAASDVWKRLGW